jgi:hypothetical protein
VNAEARPAQPRSLKIKPGAELKISAVDLSSEWARWRRLRAIAIGLEALAKHSDGAVKDQAETLIAAVRLECMLIDTRQRLATSTMTSAVTT